MHSNTLSWYDMQNDLYVKGGKIWKGRVDYILKALWKLFINIVWISIERQWVLLVRWINKSYSCDMR